MNLTSEPEAEHTDRSGARLKADLPPLFALLSFPGRRPLSRPKRSAQTPEAKRYTLVSGRGVITPKSD